MYWSLLAHSAGAYPGFHGAWSEKEYYYCFLDRVQVHRKATLGISSDFPKNSPVPIYTPVRREAVWKWGVLSKACRRFTIRVEFWISLLFHNFTMFTTSRVYKRRVVVSCFTCGSIISFETTNLTYKLRNLFCFTSTEFFSLKYWTFARNGFQR